MLAASMVVRMNVHLIGGKDLANSVEPKKYQHDTDDSLENAFGLLRYLHLNEYYECSDNEQ